MNQLKDDLEDVVGTLYRIIDCIKFFNNVYGYNDCNNCAVKNNCEYVPEPGQLTRINCPLWKNPLQVGEWKKIEGVRHFCNEKQI